MGTFRRRRSHLLGHLTEVADVAQHGAPDDGVRQVLQVPLRVEVRMEGVDALHGGGALLAVPENQVNPQVEVGAHVVAFQGLQGAAARERGEKTKQTTE